MNAGIMFRYVMMVLNLLAGFLMVCRGSFGIAVLNFLAVFVLFLSVWNQYD